MEDRDLLVDDVGGGGHYQSGLKALSRSFRLAFAALAAIIIAAFVGAFTLGGLFIVQPQETVLVYRFGRHIATHTDDWHWTFPYPVDEIVRVPTNNLRLTSSSFWSSDQARAFEMGGGATTLAPGKDGYLLTGDANILLTQWELIYRITDPRKYYESTLTPTDPKRPDEVLLDSRDRQPLGTRGPQTMLKNLLDESVVAITARTNIEDALYKNVSQYQGHVLGELNRRLDGLRGEAGVDLGVTIVDLMLRGNAPPAPTARAFASVIEAETESSTEQERAKSYAIRAENEALSEKSRIVTEAESYKKRHIATIQAETDYFKKILEEYQRNSAVVLVSLFNEKVSEAIAGVADKFVIRNAPGTRQEVRVKLNPEPTTGKRGDDNKQGGGAR